MTEKLTIVTVVFDAEVALLELQAHSLAQHARPEDIHEILVLDNCVRPLSARSRRRLLAAYGRALARVVRIVRASALVGVEGADGWRSQQIAKLKVALDVATAHYVVLDAKNHFIRRIDTRDFVGADGRAHGGSHPYQTHPLRGSVESTLRYLGADEAAVQAALLSFPPTATPFVFDTAVVRELIDDVESRAAVPFGVEFERQQLIEFVLYSGWADIRGPGIDSVIDGTPIPSPTVWPKAASAEGVAAAIAEVKRDSAGVFAVHRRVFVRGDRATRRAIADYWASSGLLSPRRARARVRNVRWRYYPAMMRTRLQERLDRTFRSRPHD